MGFDLHGIAPKNKVGDYFRNNVWWWRPLWDYVAMTCDDVLTKEDIEHGSYNDGWEISRAKANDIADRLEFYIEVGHTAKYKQDYDKMLADLPLEDCDTCKGTGQRNDAYVKGKCNACDGKGKRKDFNTHYPFSVENVREFAQFCRDSGGFSIC